jgi:AcrR family transcriptional regulator
MTTGGRRAEAARNDERILEAARAVFLADPGAPVAAVAERAGVGIGALYRRYRSKDELLRRLAADGLGRYLAELEAGLADDGDPWEAFAAFMRRAVDAGASSITHRLAGRFTADDELTREGRRAYELTQRLLHRTKAAGALREDVEVADLSLLFEALQGIEVADPERSRELRRRYLALLLDALRDASAEALPGPAPSWLEMTSRYGQRRGRPAGASRRRTSTAAG